MANCHWCANLEEAHEEHAVAKGCFDMVFALSEAQEHTQNVEQANERLCRDLALAQDDVLLEARNIWGVHRREWASVLDQEWYRLKERLNSMGIPFSGDSPWQRLVERTKRNRRYASKQAQRKSPSKPVDV